MNNFSLNNYLLVNIYWISFLLPGFIIFRLISKETVNFLSAVVYSFFISCSLYLPFAIVAYFGKININFLLIYFVVTFVLALVYLIKKPTLVKFSIKSAWLSLDPTSKILLCITVLIILFNFIISAFTKGFILFEWDAWFHIAKINKDAWNGISILDPYFFQPGKEIIQSNYPSNLVHIIFALGKKITSINAVVFWSYSNTFFQLIATSTIYVFLKKLTKNTSLSLFSLIIYIFFNILTITFATSTYPAFVALICFFFLLIVLFDLDTEKVPFWLYPVAVLLLSFIHPIQADLGVLLLGSFFILLFLMRKYDLKTLFKHGLPLLLAIPTSVATLFFSKYVPKTVLDISSEQLIHLNKNIYFLKYPYTLHSPELWLLLLGAAILPIFLKNKKRIFIYFLVVFNIVLLYTPVFSILARFIPAWGIMRYDWFNQIITLFIVFLPLYYLLDLTFKKITMDYLGKITLIFVIFTLITISQQDRINDFYTTARDNRAAITRSSELIELSSKIDENAIVLANKRVSFAIAGVTNCYVVGLDSNRTTDSIPTKDREDDLITFLNPFTTTSKRATIVNKYDVKYVIFEKQLDAYKSINLEDLGFKKIEETDGYQLYKKN